MALRGRRSARSITTRWAVGHSLTRRRVLPRTIGTWSCLRKLCRSQVSGQYYGASWSTIGTVDNYEMGGWAQFDAAAGVAKDNWNVQLFAQALPISGERPVLWRFVVDDRHGR